MLKPGIQRYRRALLQILQSLVECDYTSFDKHLAKL